MLQISSSLRIILEVSLYSLYYFFGLKYVETFELFKVDFCMYSKYLFLDFYFIMKIVLMDRKLIYSSLLINYNSIIVFHK